MRSAKLPDAIHRLRAAAGRAVPVKRCGAKTRRGTPCQALPVVRHWPECPGYEPRAHVPRCGCPPANGRCRNHGGLSLATGQRTPEGRARSRQALRDHWERRRWLWARGEFDELDVQRLARLRCGPGRFGEERARAILEERARRIRAEAGLT